MKDHPSTSKAGRVGYLLGGACRRLLWQERRLWSWLHRNHVPAFLVFLMSWSARAVLITVLFYLSFWVLLMAMAVLVFSLLPVPNIQLFRDVEEDHRLSGFYDPINYNDDPDPRFDGEQ